MTRGKKRTPDFFREAGEKKDLEWIGPEVQSVRIPTGWRCKSCGYTWNTRVRTIIQGKGCKSCKSKTARLTEEHYVALAKSRDDIEWVGSLPLSTKAKTEWRCVECGHQWLTTYTSIKFGSGCMLCSGMLKKSPSEYREAGCLIGVEWIGPKVSTIKAKTRWRCPKGHIWESNLANLRERSGCPYCLDYVNGVLVSKMQRRLRAMFKGVTTKLNYPCGRFRIDIAMFILGLAIAVEYDGRHFHDEEHDEKRDEFLMENGWRVIHVCSSGKSLPTTEQLMTALASVLAGEELVKIVLEDWHALSP